jgi:hypothetical protein
MLYLIGGRGYEPAAGRAISAYAAARQSFTLDATRSQVDGLIKTAVGTSRDGGRFGGKYLIKGVAP